MMKSVVIRVEVFSIEELSSTIKQLMYVVDSIEKAYSCNCTLDFKMVGL